MFAEIKDWTDKPHVVNLLHLVMASRGEKGYNICFLDGLGLVVTEETYVELRAKLLGIKT